MKFCPKCGSAIDGSNMFCTECGTKIACPNQAENAPVKAQKNKKTKTIILWISISVGSIALLTVLFFAFILPMFNGKKTSGSKDKEDEYEYREAVDAYEEILNGEADEETIAATYPQDFWDALDDYGISKKIREDFTDIVTIGMLIEDECPAVNPEDVKVYLKVTESEKLDKDECKELADKFDEYYEEFKDSGDDDDLRMLLDIYEEGYSDIDEAYEVTIEIDKIKVDTSGLSDEELEEVDELIAVIKDGIVYDIHAVKIDDEWYLTTYEESFETLRKYDQANERWEDEMEQKKEKLYDDKVVEKVEEAEIVVIER